MFREAFRHPNISGVCFFHLQVDVLYYIVSVFFSKTPYLHYIGERCRWAVSVGVE